MVKSLTVEEVEFIAHRLARELMAWDEPIPPFTTRYPHVLESCLAVPFQKFRRKKLYATFLDQAAILFYLLIKNHPFQNGNKRVAVTTLFVFLDKNGKWLRTDEVEFFNLAKWVAASNPRLKHETVQAIKRYLKLTLVDK